MRLGQEGLWGFAVDQSEHLGSGKPGASLPESSGVLGKLCVTGTVASMSTPQADIPTASILRALDWSLHVSHLHVVGTQREFGSN